MRGRGDVGCRGWVARQRVPPLSPARLDCQIRVWYNRSIHELALVDHAGAFCPATFRFLPPCAADFAGREKIGVRFAVNRYRPKATRTLRRPRANPA